jgi:hypothetical protein
MQVFLQIFLIFFSVKIRKKTIYFHTTKVGIKNELSKYFTLKNVNSEK